VLFLIFACPAFDPAFLALESGMEDGTIPVCITARLLIVIVNKMPNKTISRVIFLLSGGILGSHAEKNGRR
jgi:hypothetical protein